MVQNKTYLAYIAGLVDGEGSLQIKRKRRCGKIHYQLWVTIGMAHRQENVAILDEVKATFGGNISTIAAKGNRVGAYHWTIVSQQGLSFLKRIRPYLKIKAKQADLLIQFQEQTVSRKGKKNDLAKFAKQEEIFCKLVPLNYKGKLRLQRLSEEPAVIAEATV